MQGPAPKEIYQRRMDSLSDAIMRCDLDYFVTGIALPYTVQTSDARLVYETEEQLKQGVGRYADALFQRGVTSMERPCESAAFLEDGLIEGFNSVRLLAGNELVVDPYLVRMRMARGDDDIWRVTQSSAATQSEKWPLLPTGFNRIEPRQDHPMTEDEARIAEFQTFLNRVNQVLLTGDYAGWRAALHLPVSFIYREGTRHIATEEDMRADFELYKQEFKIHEVDDLVRHVTSAKQVNTDQMVGTYRTYILRGAELVVDPYDSSMTLQRAEDGRWRVTSVMNALGHLNWKAGK